MFKFKRRHDATTFDSEVNGFKQSSLAFLRILACVTNTQANTMFKKHKAAGHDGIIFFKILEDFDSTFSAVFRSSVASWWKVVFALGSIL